MSSTAKTRAAAASSPEAGVSAASSDHYQLLRYSHVFASVVRELLEVKLLAEATKEPLSLHQFHLLKLLSANGRHQVGEVAEFLGVSAPAATKNIDKLERLGLAARTPCKGDRRATLLSASARGRKLVKRYEELKNERLAPVLATFTPGELEQFTRLLERFALTLLGAEQPAEGGLCLRCSAYYDERCPVQHLQDGCPYRAIRSARAGGAVAAET